MDDRVGLHLKVDGKEGERAVAQTAKQCKSRQPVVKFDRGGSSAPNRLS